MPICSMCAIRYPIAVRGSSLCRHCLARQRLSASQAQVPASANVEADVDVLEPPPDDPTGEPVPTRAFFMMAGAPVRHSERRIMWTVYDKPDFDGAYAPVEVRLHSIKVMDRGRIASATVVAPTKRKISRHAVLAAGGLDIDDE